MKMDDMAIQWNNIGFFVCLLCVLVLGRHGALKLASYFSVSAGL